MNTNENANGITTSKFSEQIAVHAIKYWFDQWLIHLI